MPARLCPHVGEVALQRPVDLRERSDAGEREEAAEAAERVDPGAGRADAQPGRQPQPGPSFAQLTESGLGDAVEP